MQDDSKKDLEEKNSTYNKPSKRINVTLIIVGICILYAFFFTTKFTMPDSITAKDEVTQLGKETEFTESRSYTLINAVYDKEKKMLEVVLDFNNEAYDNIGEYYYAVTLTGGSDKKIEIDEAFNEELFTVIRVSNVPKFSEATFMFAAQTADLDDIKDSETGTIILNKHNLTYDTVDVNKGRSAYLVERIDSIIAGYEKQLEKNQKKLAEQEDKKAAFAKEEEEFEKNKRYMSKSEIDEMEHKIAENKEGLREVNELINKYQSKVDTLKKQIEEEKAKKAEIEF